MLTPYYQDEWATIYHGDCRDVMPHLDKVDLVLTSPPYNTLPGKYAASGLHAERRTGVNKWIANAAAGYADQRDEDEYQEWLNLVIGYCIAQCRGMVWVNHKTRYRDGEAIHPVRMIKYPILAEVIWDRGCSMALNCQRFSPSHEYLLGFGTRTYWDSSANKQMSVWRIAPGNSESAHPCPYPLELAARIIRAACPPSGVVLDPFMGSGTTLRAAKDLAIKSIGIEIEEKYCEIAVNRLRQESLIGLMASGV